MLNDSQKKLKAEAKKAFDKLSGNKVSLATAESFTGGAVANAVIQIPGASNFFKEGIVCYSNESKMFRLNVKSATLDNYGAVSEKTCREMAEGLLSSPLKPDFAVATTGNAGPGTEDKSLDGECFIAAGDKNHICVRRIFLSGTREENICEGAAQALELLNESLKNKGEQ